MKTLSAFLVSVFLLSTGAAAAPRPAESCAPAQSCCCAPDDGGCCSVSADAAPASLAIAPQSFSAVSVAAVVRSATEPRPDEPALRRSDFVCQTTTGPRPRDGRTSRSPPAA